LIECKKGKKIYFMIDSKTHIERINTIATSLQTKALICLDIDMSTHFLNLHFGVYRSPIRSLDDVKRLFSDLKQFKNVELKGRA
ncbi:MAG: hypothetical protein OQJ89_12340, partial [Kangiellaceae bacterium]|nr:hypothetical protein [Kangiellaceae bacterium]